MTLFEAVTVEEQLRDTPGIYPSLDEVAPGEWEVMAFDERTGDITVIRTAAPA